MDCVSQAHSKLLKRLIDGGTSLRDSRLGIDTTVVKRAELVDDEVLGKLASLQLVPGSPNDQTRSAALLAVVFVMRFADVPNIRCDDITVRESPEETLVLLRVYSTKTNPVEERQTACQSGARKACTKPFCLAHYLKLRKNTCGRGSEKVFPVLTKANFIGKLKHLAKQEFPDLDVDKLTNHSLRRTGAAKLSALGVAGEEVRLAGHWQSSVWQTYAESGIRARTKTHSDLILG
jgi:integrase